MAFSDQTVVNANALTIDHTDSTTRNSRESDLDFITRAIDAVDVSGIAYIETKIGDGRVYTKRLTNDTDSQFKTHHLNDCKAAAGL